MNRIGGAGKSPKALEPNSALWNKGFVIIILVSCLVSFGNFIVGSAFSYWIIDIGGTRATFGLVHGLYSALCLISRPITGWFADNGNRRVTFILSCFVYVSSMILMLFSPIFGLFVGLRLIQGLGIGSAQTMVTACSYDEIPVSQMDRGVGYIALINSLATSATPALAIKTYNTGGPGPLVVWSTIAIVTGIAVSFFVTFRKNEAPEKKKLRDVFDVRQLFDIRCLKPAIPLAFSVNLTMGVQTFLTLYGREIGIPNPGWFATLSAIVMVAARLLLDRFKAADPFPRKRIYMSFVLFFAKLIVLGFCKNTFMYCLAAVLSASGNAILSPLLSSMVIRSVPNERRGVAASTVGICGDIGMIIGSIGGGFIAEALGYSTLYFVSIIPVAFCVIYYRAVLDGKFVPWDMRGTKEKELPASGEKQ